MSFGTPPVIDERCRLLAVCYMLPPAQYPQAIQIGRLLSHSAHDVVSVCGETGNSDLTAGWRHSTSGQRLELPPKPRRWPIFHRTAMRLLPFYGAMPDEYVAWARSAEHAVMSSSEIAAFKPQIIITFGEPMSDHLLGRQIAKRLRLPWIAHFSDPWADNPYRRPHKLAKWRNRQLEADVVAHANALIVTSDETRNLFVSKYGEAITSKINVLAHSFEPALYPAHTRKPKDPLVVRYLGNFYGQRTPVPVLRAIERLKRTNFDALSRLRFEFVGGMPFWLRHHPVVRGADPQYVSFVPTVGYTDSLRLMVDADLLLVIDAPCKVSLFLPSKLIDYLGANRPILGVVPPGPSQRLLRELGEAVVDPLDVDGICAELAKFVENHLAVDNAVAGRRAAVASYEAPRVAAQFDSIVRQVAVDKSWASWKLSSHA